MFRFLAASAIAACGSGSARPPSDAHAPVAPPPPAPVLDAAACPGPPASEEVTFPAADGHVVHATWKNPCGAAARPAVVLAHQMCRDRSEWGAPSHDWIGALSRRGLATLAIDLRGHGASRQLADGSTHDLCKETSDPAARGRYAGMVDDVRAAVAWAKGKGASRVALVGASIGANSALVVFAGDPTLAMVVALSPGRDYRGIQAVDAVRRAAGRAVFLYAADDDDASAATLADVRSVAGVQAKTWPEGGHGNRLLDAHPEELDVLADRLAASLREK